MAQTFAAAFAAAGVEGRILDASAEQGRPAYRERDPVVAAAVRLFADEAQARIGGLAYLTRASYEDGEEAMQDAFMAMLIEEPDTFLEPDWLGMLFTRARTLMMRRRSEGLAAPVDSIQRLEVASRSEDGDPFGDDPFRDARPVVAYTPVGVNEEARYIPPPAKGEAWTELQIVGSFQRFRDVFGRPPRTKDLIPAEGMPSYTAVKRVFGGINAAILASGMVPDVAEKRTRRWKAVDTAEEVLRFRRRHGFWPNGSGDLARWPHELPSRAAMERFLGGATAYQVQRGAEDILGPIDQAKPDGKLTERLRSAWEAAKSQGGGGASPASPRLAT